MTFINTDRLHTELAAIDAATGELSKELQHRDQMAIRRGARADEYVRSVAISLAREVLRNRK